MPLAATMGLARPTWPTFSISRQVRPENCVLVGVRDIDAVEKENVRGLYRVFTMRDIDERGMRTVMERRYAWPGAHCRLSHFSRQ